MLDVTIYEKDGKRHLYDHVSQITNISDNVVIDFITDFGDQLTKTLNKDSVEYMTVRVMK
jgi:hypothetical protein